MKTFRNVHFKKRDYECTNIVAIRAESLPKGYRPEDWAESDDTVIERLTYLGAVYQNGERFEKYGYL